MRAILLALAVAGCAEGPPARQDDLPAAAVAPSSPRELELTLRVELSRRPIVSGSTNLPDGTQLMVWIRSPDGERYNGQATVPVEDGRFEAGPFGDRGNPLRPGPYRLSVSASLASLQPESVREQLGENYSNYRGDMIEGSDLGRSVHREIGFTVR